MLDRRLLHVLPPLVLILAALAGAARVRDADHLATGAAGAANAARADVPQRTHPKDVYNWKDDAELGSVTVREEHLNMLNPMQVSEEFVGDWELTPITDSGTQKLLYKGSRPGRISYAFAVLFVATDECNLNHTQEPRSCNNQWQEEYANLVVVSKQVPGEPCPVAITHAQFIDMRPDGVIFSWFVMPLLGRDISTGAGQNLQDDDVKMAIAVNQFCKGAEWLHRRRLLHRDVKGDNALMSVNEERAQRIAQDCPGPHCDPDRYYEVSLIDLGLLVDLPMYEALHTVPTVEESEGLQSGILTHEEGDEIVDWIFPNSTYGDVSVQHPIRSYGRRWHGISSLGSLVGSGRGEPSLEEWVPHEREELSKGVRSNMWLLKRADVQGSRPQAPEKTSAMPVAEFPAWGHDAWHMGMALAEMAQGHTFRKAVALFYRITYRTSGQGGRALVRRVLSHSEINPAPHVTAMLNYIRRGLLEPDVTHRVSSAECVALTHAALTQDLFEEFLKGGPDEKEPCFRKSIRGRPGFDWQHNCAASSRCDWNSDEETCVPLCAEADNQHRHTCLNGGITSCVWDSEGGVCSDAPAAGMTGPGMTDHDWEDEEKDESMEECLMKWQVQEGGAWVDYDAATQAELKRAKHAGKWVARRVDDRAGWMESRTSGGLQHYIVDLVGMTEVSLHTGVERRVRQLEAPMPVGGGTSVDDSVWQEPFSKWQVRTSVGWEDLHDRQQAAMRRAIANGDPVVHYKRAGKPYVINIQNSVQVDLEEETTSPIRELEAVLVATEEVPENQFMESGYQAEEIAVAHQIARGRHEVVDRFFPCHTQPVALLNPEEVFDSLQCRRMVCTETCLAGSAFERWVDNATCHNRSLTHMQAAHLRPYLHYVMSFECDSECAAFLLPRPSSPDRLLPYLPGVAGQIPPVDFAFRCPWHTSAARYATDAVTDAVKGFTGRVSRGIDAVTDAVSGAENNRGHPRSYGILGAVAGEAVPEAPGWREPSMLRAAESDELDELASASVLEPVCGLAAPSNAECRSHVTWAFQRGRHQTWADIAYGAMDRVAGRHHSNATSQDFARLFYCGEVEVFRCGAPPCTCSVPPCDWCPPALRGEA